MIHCGDIIGPVYEAFKHKYWVDELYWRLILDPYVSLSRFLADVVDWRFWHDWFHDTVLLGGFNLITRLLALRIDLGIIDAAANGLGSLTQKISAGLRRLADRLCSQLCPIDLPGSGHYPGISAVDVILSLMQ